MHFDTGLRQKMREDFAHPGLNPLSFLISSNCQTLVLDFGISLKQEKKGMLNPFFITDILNDQNGMRYIY